MSTTHAHTTYDARLFFSELLEAHADVCVAYVLDAASRGRDWLTELGGVDLMLRSQVRQQRRMCCLASCRGAVGQTKETKTGRKRAFLAC